MYSVAVDIGGTFTDVVAIDDATGRTVIGKVPTTQDDLQRGVVAGLTQVADEIGSGLSALLADTHRFIHATTQSTNAVFAETGARTAVLTTRGFADTLMFMRATGRVAGLSVFERHHYRATQKPRPLVDERDIFEIDERVDRDGVVLVGLDRAQVREVAATLAVRGYEAVAICFLFSHKNPAHERAAAAVLRDALPNAYVTAAVDIAPMQGEYERSATALFNAYVGRLIEDYVVRLEATLADAGLAHPMLMVQANGGVATATQTVPVMTIESGPAAGVVGAAHLATALGYRHVVATDVGGTTFKVALIEDGAWHYARETVVKQYQLRLPMIDIASIGAGGGSIAWVDGHRLRVGPQSAAAAPGPACYGLGGGVPTVTDADVVLGYISPDRFLDGRMTLHPDLAYTAIRTHIAAPLFGGDVIAAAAGVRRVIDSQMADLIRKSTLERGHDVRNFAMMAYGGAGPTHAAAYGFESGCREIVIPAIATVHSAFGAVLSDVRFSLRHSDPMVLPVAPVRLAEIYMRMDEAGHALLAEADVAAADAAFERWVEARYRRQVHTVRVPAPALWDDASLAAVAAAFHAEYERLFGAGTGLADAGIELVNYGVDAIGRVPRHRAAIVGAGGMVTPCKRRLAWCPHRQAMIDTPVYDGVALTADATFAGPAIVEAPGTTVVVLVGQTARVDDGGHIHLTATAAG